MQKALSSLAVCIALTALTPSLASASTITYSGGVDTVTLSGDFTFRNGFFITVRGTHTVSITRANRRDGTDGTRNTSQLIGRADNQFRTVTYTPFSGMGGGAAIAAVADWTLTAAAEAPAGSGTFGGSVVAPDPSARMTFAAGLLRDCVITVGAVSLAGRWTNTTQELVIAPQQIPFTTNNRPNNRCDGADSGSGAFSETLRVTAGRLTLS